MIRRIRLLALMFIAAAPAAAQVNSEKYQGMFLVGEFGELCTMCEAVILCEAGDAAPSYEAVPVTGDFTLYHIQTRTFWSQVSTIWEWFVANFNAESLAQGHTRPVFVYAISGDNWSPATVAEAHMALEPPSIGLGAERIDRKNQAWLSADSDTMLGYCTRMPLWDSIAAIESHAPGAQP